MARRFRGEGEQTIDGKGRASVPPLFRRVLEACDPDWSEGQRANLVIVYGADSQKFLECYTMEAIDEIDARIDCMKKGSLERKMMERRFHAHSMPAQVLEDGRIMLGAKLRNKLDLENKAFFIASGDHFQIWKPETYETEEIAKEEAWLAEQGDDFDITSLLPDLPES